MADTRVLKNTEQILEGILFAYGEPLSLKKLAEITKKPASEISLALTNLKKTLESRGIRLILKDTICQLAADKSSSSYIEKLVQSEMKEELTPASLEVLSITAYRGPVSKSEIETIRGVNSGYALRNLTLRGLVEKNETVKPHLFNISLAALRKLGLTAAEELPRYLELNQEIKKTETVLFDKP
ncbi:MAG: SMC-Scp complex subunit ScpB [Parcubacteria group bacterium]|nr:SMC-Scp complex subunit ScpB [Parcubacteria group bacterium]